MSNVIQIEARCRVENLTELSEDDLVALLAKASGLLEERVAQAAPVAFAEGDELCALGSFEGFPAGGFDEIEASLHEMVVTLRAAVDSMRVAGLTTSWRELVPA